MTSDAAPAPSSAGLRYLGYTGLLGVDPYIEADLAQNGVIVKRQTLDATTGEWDLIMFHHSLEHMPDQPGTLAAARRLLAPGGTCVGFTVRKVVDDSTAFQFTGSELYRRDIPWSGADPAALFSVREIRYFTEHTRELNRQGQGDQAAFYLGA